MRGAGHRGLGAEQRVSTEALLLMDLQNGVVGRLSSSQRQPLLGTIARTASDAAGWACRSSTSVSHSDRAGPMSVRGTGSSRTWQAAPAWARLDHSTQIHPAVSPHPGDIVVTKRRVSAFSGSDLEVVLRSLDVRSLTLSGIATSGVVLSTLRQAADLDFGLTVLRDCCVDPDDDVQRVLMEKVFPRQATVESAAQWVARLGPGSEARERLS